MPPYTLFSRCYDAVMGDRALSITHVEELIRETNPTAQTLLELACGTGALLEHFQTRLSVTGLDISADMLSVAKQKLPGVELHHRSMTDFSLDQRFDVIICMYDSINHLLEFADWQKVFAHAAAHLAEGGIFIFDINTEYHLKGFIEDPPWVKELDEGTFIMDVQDAGAGISNWNIKLFRRKSEGTYILEEENIREVSFPCGQIQEALQRTFSSIRCVDFSQPEPTDRSECLYFVCKK